MRKEIRQLAVEFPPVGVDIKRTRRTDWHEPPTPELPTAGSREKEFHENPYYRVQSAPRERKKLITAKRRPRCDVSDAALRNTEREIFACTVRPRSDCFWRTRETFSPWNLCARESEFRRKHERRASTKRACIFRFVSYLYL